MIRERMTDGQTQSRIEKNKFDKTPFLHSVPDVLTGKQNDFYRSFGKIRLGIYPGILKDKTLDDKLMHISNYECSLIFRWKGFQVNE